MGGSIGDAFKSLTAHKFLRKPQDVEVSLAKVYTIQTALMKS
jgi:hypothetical protein